MPKRSIARVWAEEIAAELAQFERCCSPVCLGCTADFIEPMLTKAIRRGRARPDSSQPWNPGAGS